MIRKYSECFQLGLQRSMQYRFDFVMSLIGVVIPIGIQFFLWTAIYHGTGKSALYGFQYPQMIVYTTMAAITSRLVGTGFENSIAEDIKNGGLNKFIVQPIHYIWYRILWFFGDKVPSSGMLCVTAAGTFLLLESRGAIALRVDLSSVLIYLTVTLFALVLNCLISINVSMIAFWLVDTSGFFALTSSLTAIVSGGVLPLNIYGRFVMSGLNFLPFEYTVYFPVNVLTGRLSSQDLLRGFEMQMIWISVLLIFSFIIWKAGLKKYVAVGG